MIIYSTIHTIMETQCNWGKIQQSINQSVNQSLHYLIHEWENLKLILSSLADTKRNEKYCRI